LILARVTASIASVVVSTLTTFASLSLASLFSLLHYISECCRNEEKHDKNRQESLAVHLQKLVLNLILILAVWYLFVDVWLLLLLLLLLLLFAIVIRNENK